MPVRANARVFAVAALAAFAGASASPAICSADVPPAAFVDPARKAKLLAAIPEVEKALGAHAEAKKFPGAVAGLVVDGELVSTKGWGARAPGAAAPDLDTVFRIASMSKSFTALAVLKLRDEGKLSLEDPAARWIPELAGMPKATADSPEITLRHLLTHSEGFPEDNPWGDRQLPKSDAFLLAMAKAGIPFSNAPGVAFEYSNTGFALLGQVVARASGMRYRDYVDANILKPLGLTSTYWEASAVPKERLAVGMKLVDGAPAVVADAHLPDGAFGAMGGLYSTVRDLARYTAFFLSAWPPRDDPDAGPVKRSSLREMQQAARFFGASVRPPSEGQPLRLSAGGYGYGLNERMSCTFTRIVSHAGGLPGFGSLMLWLPEHGVAFVGLTNLTYGGWAGGFADGISALEKTGALKPRAARPAPALLAAQAAVDRLYDAWDDAAFDAAAAENLALDEPRVARRAAFEALKAKHGACGAGAIAAENALRGEWTRPCATGEVTFRITLAPTRPPKVQRLEAKDGPAPADGGPCSP